MVAWSRCFGSSVMQYITMGNACRTKQLASWWSGSQVRETWRLGSQCHLERYIPCDLISSLLAPHFEYCKQCHTLVTNSLTWSLLRNDLDLNYNSEVTDKYIYLIQFQ